MTRNVYSYARENISLLVSGGFNIDVSKQENVEFVTFMEEYIKLRLLSTSSQATTLGGTCIDLVFGKNIDVESRRYVSYFSCHRPLLSLIKSSEQAQTQYFYFSYTEFCQYRNGEDNSEEVSSSNIQWSKTEQPIDPTPQTVLFRTTTMIKKS